MTETATNQNGWVAKSGVEKLGYVLAGVFSLIIITVIAFFVLDEANARFGTIALSVVIVVLTRPAARFAPLAQKPTLGWLFDLTIVAAFLFSAWWFY